LSAINDFKPHKGQATVLASARRFVATISGVQGGKTTVGAIWLLREIYRDYQAGIKGDYCIAAPTNKVLQQSTLVKFREYFPSDWGVYREQKQVFELKWGGTIFVRSAEDPNLLEGMTLRAAWLDEAGQMKASVWTIMQARVAIASKTGSGRILMTSTPYAQNWYYRDIFKKCAWLNGKEQRGPAINPDLEIVTWGSSDNPYFPIEEMERAKSSMSQALFERRYTGAFTQLEGLVYPFDPQIHVVEPFTIPDNWQKFGGQDFGMSDPTVVLAITEDPTTHVYYVFDEFYKSNSQIKESVQFIQWMGLQRVLADPSEAQMINELRTQYHLGMVQPADNDLDVGIQRVTKLLNEGRLKFFARKTRNAVDEIEAYHYPAPDPDKVRPDKPVDKDNHAMDALRYAFSRPMPGLYNEPGQTQGRTKRRYTPALTRSQWQQGIHPYTAY
jgi:phage terminase large subunit